MKKIRWVISLGLLLMGIGIIVTTMLPEATQYYLTADELLAKEAMFSNQEIKVAGTVVDGSIDHKRETASWGFEIENEGQRVRIQYQGAMPDTFKEGAEVVATGTFQKNKIFVANNILAKCASRYEEKLDPKLETQVEES